MSMEYALSYLSQGYAVFPLQPNGKTPLTPNGFKDASKDPEIVRQWWMRWPEANVGIVTGRASGIVVLDVDRKHGVDGVVSAGELDLPPTLTIRTPSGGFHLFYKAPNGTIVPRKIGVKPGLDILGESGYVVGAGSYVNGSAYEIVRSRTIADCPQILIDLAGKQNTNVAPTEPEKGKIGEGQRNAYLTSIGGKLRRIGFSSDELVGALMAINTLRLDPPVTEAEVRRTAASVARYMPDGDAAERADETSVITSQPLEDLLRATYPPVEHLSNPILVHPGLCLLYGPSGISKTYFTLAWALSVASGQRFLKWEAGERPRGVLYIDGELGARVMQQRVRLLQAGHEFVVRAPFHVASFDAQPNGLFPDLESPTAQLRYLNGIPDDVHLVVIDSLSTLCSMEESNDYKSWSHVQKFLLALRRRGTSVIVVHHANKGGNDQAGTSRRIHVMDTVISLRAHQSPEGETPGHKDVEVHVTKGRNLPPNMSEPFIASLSGHFVNMKGDNLAWSCGELGARKTEQVEEMLRLGIPLSQIVAETGCGVSFAYRIKDRLVREGGLNWKPSKTGRKPRGDSYE